MNLQSDEKLEDLGYQGLQLIQSTKLYRFTTDAVLLANFCHDLSGKFCVEFGTGSGVVSILVAAKKHPKKIVAIEIQPQMHNLAVRNVQLNNLQGQIDVVLDDLKNAPKILGNNLCDAVICNPPYRKVGSGQTQLDPVLAVCRHEVSATLADVIGSAAKILNNKGSLYLVHQASRLAEIITLSAQNNLAVKEILPVCPRPNAQPNLVLIRAVKCGASDCKLYAPLSVLDADGNYSPQAKAWYNLQ